MLLIMQRTANSNPTQPSPVRQILMADCDMYYVQVARMVDPEGAGSAELLIVGGSRESRGVVCSASYEVRAFGVRSGMSIAQATRLCPAAMCVPVPRAACSLKSREILAVLDLYAPLVESASPDEAFMDVTAAMDSVYRGQSLEQLAHAVRTAVLSATGITVSVGGGTSKLIAKMSVEFAKPRPGTGATGIFVVQPGEEARFLAQFALADFPGVGPRFQQRLHQIGWRTVHDVLPHDAATLKQVLGARAGAWLHDRIRGVDTAPVEARSEPKSMSREETFPRDLNDDTSLRSELVQLTDRVAADARAAGYTARTITVRVKYADFTTRQAGRTLAEGVQTAHAIAPVARELLDRLRRGRRGPLRLLGISLSQFEAVGEELQLGLFDSDENPAEQGTDTEHQRALAAAMDAVRDRFGFESIVLGKRGGVSAPGGPGRTGSLPGSE